MNEVEIEDGAGSSKIKMRKEDSRQSLCKSPELGRWSTVEYGMR